MPTLKLSPDAKRLWVEFHDSIERELSPSGEMATARDFAAKAADNAARLAAIFHILANGPTGEIGVDSMSAAARVVSWHYLEDSTVYWGTRCAEADSERPGPRGVVAGPLPNRRGCIPARCSATRTHQG